MDKLNEFLYTMESCNSCGQCRFVLGPNSRGRDYVEICPIYSKYLFEAYSGQGIINIAQELLEGKLEYSKDLIKHVYSCTTCGACDTNCKSVRDMEVMDTILALREQCVEDGWGPMPAHRDYAVAVEQHHNISGEAHSRRFEWLPGSVELSPDSGTAYFVGCTTAYRRPEIALDTMKLLQAGGVPFTLLKEDEYCCGAPLWRTGQAAEAVKLVNHTMEALKKRNIKTLIVSCGECYGTFKGLYPRIAKLDFEVLHISEVIVKLLREKRLKFSKTVPMKVTYHDPCLLGRLSEQYVPWKGEIKAFGYHEPPKQFRRGTFGVYDAPREILNAIPGLELVEMPRHAENAFCCGGGGGVPDAFPDFSRWVAGQRLEEAVSTGAEAIVSACPLCQSAFESAKAGGDKPLRYFDITSLAASAIQQ